MPNEFAYEITYESLCTESSLFGFKI